MKKILVILMMVCLHSWNHVAAQDIIVAEYFIDTDPGIDAATKVGVKAFPTINDQAFSADLSALSAGPHQFFYRVKDANGVWSVTERVPFYCFVAPSLPPSVNITNGEYFVDTDPGVGNGTAVTLTPGQSLDNQIITAPVGSLADGDHTLFVRFKNANGVWSVSQSSVFSVHTLAVPTALAGTSVTSSSFVANWAAVANAISYELDVSADKFVTFIPGYHSKSISGTSADVSGLTPNTTYEYRIRAAMSTGTSGNSNSIDVSTLTGNPVIRIEQDDLPISNNGTYDFGNVAMNSNSGDITFFVRNTGTLPLNINLAGSSLTGPGASDFTVDLTTLPASIMGTAIPVRIRFTPTDSGVRSALISIASNDPLQNPFVVNLKGKGTKLDQAIAFEALPSKTVGDGSFQVQANASSMLPVQFTSSDSMVATVSGNTVTIVGAGTSTITASQQGDKNYNQAMPATQILTVNKLTQSVQFDPLPDRAIGDPDFSLSATASSGLPVSYSSLSNNISIDGSNVKMILAGRVLITSMQSGNSDYAAATPVSQGFCINPAKPVISIVDANTEAPILSSSAASGNQWYRNDVVMTGEDKQALNVSQPGVYTVRVSANDCFSVFSLDFAIIITGNINFLETPPIVVSPNPVDDLLEINGLPDRIDSYQFYDMKGRSVSVDLRKVGEKYHAPVSHLSQGVYLLRFRDDQKLFQIKFIKQ